ncbi:hypothetical protein TNCV_4560401 [Trichonephila clavipes]|nr:hypothetical protein TNCV_4560401 [Trichonephila clavipes]
MMKFIFVFCPKQKRGCSSLVVKDMVSWLVYHKFEPGTAEDPPIRGRCMLDMSRLTHPPISEVWKLGERVQLRCRFSEIVRRNITLT